MKKKTIVFVQNVEYPQQGAVDMFYYSKYLSKYQDIHVKVIVSKINEDISHEDLELIELGNTNYVMFIIKSFFLIKSLKREEGIEYVYFFAQHPFSVILQFFVRYILKIRTIYDVVSGPIGNGIVSYITKTTIKVGVFLSDIYIILDKGLIAGLRLSETKKYEVVGMGYDDEIFYEKKDIALFGRKNNEIIFTYIGTLNRERKLDIFIKAFIENLKEFDNIKLYFIGGGNGEDILRKQSGKYLNEKIFFLGQKEHKKIPDYINSSDILISYVPKVDYFDHQPPTKLIEYLACNKPVIVTNTIAQSEILEGYDYLIHQDNWESTSKKIFYFIKNLNEIRQNNFYSIVRNYSWKELIKRIKGIL